MYTKELETMYELIIAGKKLTQLNLSSLGITDNILDSMLNEGLIYQLSPSEYQITSINKFYLYGKKLLLMRNRRAANICFELCHKMDPNNRDVTLQLFLYAIQREDYEDVLKYFKELEEINSADYRIDHNIYLYFINLVNKLPEEYSERITKIKNSHHSLDYRKPNKEQAKINEIMYLVKKAKFSYALTKLNDLLGRDQNYSVERLILKQFLIQAINLEAIFKNKLVLSANKHAYEAIIFELDRKSERRKLRQDEKDIYELASSLLTMNATNKVPEIVSPDATTISEAIHFHDFEKALALEESFIAHNEEVNKVKAPDNALYILLRQINDRIVRLNFAQPQDEPDSHPSALIYQPK